MASTREGETGAVRGNRRIRHSVLTLSVLLLLGLVIQITAHRAGKIPWTSDQAVTGLMAKHIVEKGTHPVFYYGQAYGGALETYFLAAVFSLLGPTAFAFDVAMYVWLAFLLVLVFALGRQAFGSEAALYAVAFLAIPPCFFLLKGLTSSSIYVTLALLAAAMLSAALAVEERLSGGRSPGQAIGLLGLLAGIAWWTDPLAVYFYLAILAWFLLVRPSVFRQFRSYPVFLLSFALGSLPWWLANLHDSWPSLRIPEAARLPVREAAVGFIRFWTTAVPVLFGARPFYEAAPLFPGAGIVAFLIYAVPVLFAAGAVLTAALGKKRRDPPDPKSAARPLLLLLMMMASMQFVVSWSARSYQSSPRFLFPMYVPFALLIGFFFSRARRRVPPLLLIAAAGGVLAFQALGIARAPREDDFATQPTTGRVDPIIRALDARGLTDVYTGYWLANRLAFESRERIQDATIGLDGLDRYPPYAEHVAQSTKPAVILTGEEAEAFAQFVERTGARADQVRVGPYVIFWDLPSGLVELLARTRTYPDTAPR
jgi:4-amino-4-deoxy-L-arabinose transferase-like glycosyltransferase